jgi:hypothetical protein
VVLAWVVRRMAKYLRRRSELAAAGVGDDDPAGGENDSDDGGEQRLEASAVSGQTPPAGPQWQHGLAPLASRALAFVSLKWSDFTSGRPQAGVDPKQLLGFIWFFGWNGSASTPYAGDLTIVDVKFLTGGADAAAE